MRAGKLRTRVTIETMTETQDNTGDPVQSWASAGTRWAHVKRVVSNRKTEVFVGDQFRAEAVWSIKMRYDSLTNTISVKDRFTFDSRYFNIQSIWNEDDRNEYITFVVYEVQDEYKDSA